MRFLITTLTAFSLLLTVFNANARCVDNRSSFTKHNGVLFRDPVSQENLANGLFTICEDGRFKTVQKFENGLIVGSIIYSEDVYNGIKQQVCWEGEPTIQNFSEGEGLSYDDGKITERLYVDKKDSSNEYVVSRDGTGICVKKSRDMADEVEVSCTEIEPTKNFLDRCGTAPASKSTSLLSGYDARTASHSMRCDTRQTGWKKYEIIDDDLVVDGFHKLPILEREGKVFATKTNNILGEIVIIADYSKKQLTQKSSIGTEVFDCL